MTIYQHHIALMIHFLTRNLDRAADAAVGKVSDDVITIGVSGGATPGGGKAPGIGAGVVDRALVDEGEHTVPAAPTGRGRGRGRGRSRRGARDPRSHEDRVDPQRARGRDRRRAARRRWRPSRQGSATADHHPQGPRPRRIEGLSGHE